MLAHVGQPKLPRPRTIRGRYVTFIIGWGAIEPVRWPGGSRKVPTKPPPLIMRPTREGVREAKAALKATYSTTDLTGRALLAGYQTDVARAETDMLEDFLGNGWDMPEEDAISEDLWMTGDGEYVPLPSVARPVVYYWELGSIRSYVTDWAEGDDTWWSAHLMRLTLAEREKLAIKLEAER